MKTQNNLKVDVNGLKIMMMELLSVLRIIGVI